MVEWLHLFFSIVVVSLNPGEKLVPTLKSVLDQDYRNFGNYH